MLTPSGNVSSAKVGDGRARDSRGTTGIERSAGEECSSQGEKDMVLNLGKWERGQRTLPDGGRNLEEEVHPGGKSRRYLKRLVNLTLSFFCADQFVLPGGDIVSMISVLLGTYRFYIRNG